MKNKLDVESKKTTKKAANVKAPNAKEIAFKLKGLEISGKLIAISKKQLKTLESTFKMLQKVNEKYGL